MSSTQVDETHSGLYNYPNFDSKENDVTSLGLTTGPLSDWSPHEATPDKLQFRFALTSDPNKVDALRPQKPNTFVVLLIECHNRNDASHNTNTEMLYCVFAGKREWVPIGAPKGFVAILGQDEERARRFIESEPTLKLAHLACELNFSGKVENPIENWWCAVKR